MALDFGRKLYSVALFEPRGEIEVCEDGVNIRIEGRGLMQVKRSYFKSIEKTGDSALNKCKARIAYYDLLGSLNSLDCTMQIGSFAALKSDLGK